MIAREVARRCIVGWTLLPLYWDFLVARSSRALAVGLASPKRKLAALGVFLTMAAGSAWQGWYLFSLLWAAPVLVLVASQAKKKLIRRWLLREIVRRRHNPGMVPPARETLQAMGISQTAISRILTAAASNGEALVAELDQNNRVLSHVGDIPLYQAALATPDEFRKRSRNRMQIVVTSGVVAVKKKYGIYGLFINEVIALDALSGIDGVPKILAVNPKEGVLYQSFLLGKNLGSLMAERGASVSLQYRVGKAYPGRADWSGSERVPRERALVLQALHETVDDHFIASLGKLVATIHNAGVALHDVKHGNVLICDNRPHLCDFDVSCFFPTNNTRFILTTEKERDRFNYLFGGTLLTERSFRRALRSLGRGPAETRFPPVYFGKGYRFRKIKSIESSSGKWLFIKRHLPDLSGQKIIDLGGNHGILALEMLRAGAAKVRACEPDPISADFAELIRQFFEFTDNRTYDFEVVKRRPVEMSAHEVAHFTMATAFGALYEEPLEDVRKISALLSRSVEIFIVECKDSDNLASNKSSRGSSVASVRRSLAESGFAQQTVIEFGDYAWPLIIARSDSSHGPK
jgi:serine/threonine protein kinase